MPRKKPNTHQVIDNIYTQLNNAEPLNKTYTILSTIRSGNFYNSSNNRKTLLTEYNKLVTNLSDSDYTELKKHLSIFEITNLFEDRERRRISYSTLALLIEYSSKKDIEVYNRYERLIMTLTEDGKGSLS